MFYIDFSAPDGNSYRIDLSKQPINHICPVCGEEQLLALDDSDPYYWCDACRERKDTEEKTESDKKFWQEIISRINDLCNSDIDASTLDQWAAKAKERNLAAGEEVDFYQEKLQQLRNTVTPQWL